MRPGRLAIGAGLAVLTVIAVTIALVALEENDEVPPTAGGADTLDVSATRGGTATAAISESEPTTDGLRPRTTRRFPNAGARSALEQAIAEARRRRENRTEVARSESPGGQRLGDELAEESKVGQLEAEYIRESIREFTPLWKECYEMALENAPDLEGQLVISFTILGEEDVGGLVDDVELESEEGIDRNEGFAECMRETMLAVEFPPPEGGGQVKVRYPFRFARADEADGGS